MKSLSLIVFGVLTLSIGTSWSILVDDVRENVIQEIETAWKELKGVHQQDSSPRSTEKRLQDLSVLLSKIPEIIGQAEHEVLLYEESFKDFVRGLNNSTTWKNKWNEINILTSPIQVIYGYFKIFPDMPTTFLPGSGIMDFDASTVTNLILKPLYNVERERTSTLTYLSEHAHDAVVSNDLFGLFLKEIQKSKHCFDKTQQRMIYGLYVNLLLIDIKEYTVINFAWMLQSIINGTSSLDALKSTQKLRIQAIEKQSIAKAAIGLASSAYWRCDPQHWIEGENYDQFKELLQGYIENEVRMHPKASCKQSCDDYTFVKSRCSYPDDESCHRHRVCTGNIVECKYIAADATTCVSTAPRRFDYIDYKRGPFLGKSHTCQGETIKRDSYWRLFYHCSNCFCLCDDPNSPTTVRHISLASVTSNVHMNKIVTGVRFVMIGEVLHLQIEQGNPEKNGLIKESSTEWKPVHKVNKKNKDLVMELDYINRGFDLDDLYVPNGYVVTGIRFRHLGSHVNIEIQATQMNPITAELIHSSTHWLSNDNTPETVNPRSKLNLKDLDVPILGETSVIDSTHDQFIEFEPTSVMRDVAQMTIPYFDIQPVRPEPPVWLQGIGVYHKGSSGYGGFIGLRIFTKNLKESIENEENE